MIEDRNKTVITKLVTNAALFYLEERGFKPLETEVQVGRGWVADIAGVVVPSITELVKLKLISARPRWREGADYQTEQDEWQAKANSLSILTAIVEVKTSRGDFRGDKKWKMESPADLSYLAVPGSLLIKDDEVPEAWGILRYYETPDVVRCVRVPSFRGVSHESRLSLVLETAVRAYNNVAYQTLREIRRKSRIEETERRSTNTAIGAMTAMRAIVRGEHASVEDSLYRHNIRGFPEWLMEELKKLHGIGRSQ